MNYILILPCSVLFFVVVTGYQNYFRSFHSFHRRNELYQVALQASSIEDLIEVVRASLSVMYKQWSDAMSTFHEKFDSLASLIIDHGSFDIF